jgi:diaminobutyrate-2-oxoglutarate transaminase
MRLRDLCDRYGIMLIVDDIQVRLRQGAAFFFSFERAGIVPDMVILSKSISGYGLPMSLL